MKIVIVWYWRTWKLVEFHAKEKLYEVVKIIDPALWTKKEDMLNLDFDVIIEFSIAWVAVENMKFYAENNFKVVMATTGWYYRLDEVKEMFEKSKWALLWSWNFSVWVLIFTEIIKKSAKIMNKFDDYDIFWHEFHHNKKADSPSWTALFIANTLLDNIDRKKEIITKELSDRAIEPWELHFSSTRGGNIPWTHSVYYDSLVDTIEITHRARSRDGFAIWSLHCAYWLKDKTGYYEINNFVEDALK